MQARVSQLFRHPIKAHGFEPLAEVVFQTGTTMPWDRLWAVAHAKSKLGTDGAWAHCINFCRGARTPALMAIRARVDEAKGRVTLSHPDAANLTVDPDDPDDAARLIDWVKPLSDPGRLQPTRIVRAANRGMTDSDFPSVSILNSASLAALSERIGAPLAKARFRGNIWLDGLAPWQEFDLVGRDIRIGGAMFRARERIERCKATTANPETGHPDADTLGALKTGWGHTDFGIYAEVISGGRVATGDAAASA